MKTWKIDSHIVEELMWNMTIKEKKTVNTKVGHRKGNQ